MSIYNGHSGDLAHSGLLNFGKFDGSYEGFELPIFFAMGLLGDFSKSNFQFSNLFYQEDFLEQLLIPSIIT